MLDMDCPGLPTQEECSSMRAYQPGAATSIEVTGQSGQSSYTPLENIVPAGLRPPNRTTRTYDGPAVTLRYDRARSSMARDRR